MVLYTATSNLWPNPAVVTVSFMPDGTQLGGGTSNMISTFEANPSLSGGKWMTEILKGIQLWAQQTNVNFTVVPDDGAPAGSGDYQQGSPLHGDIRIGGYNFGAGNAALATTNMPPPVNNFDIAGDVTFNTGQPFNAGTTYDLMTVTAHEVGHSLGLDHTTAGSTAQMYTTYTGKKNLNADDIAGIRSMYSAGAARSPDAYASTNNTFAKAANLTTAIGTSLSYLLPNMDISAAGQADFYTFKVPEGSSGTMNIIAQSLGLSLLAPRITVYAANQTTVLGTFTGLMNTAGVLSVSGLTAGQQLYVKVQGADNTATGTGKYALGINFSGWIPPLQSSPVISLLKGGTIVGGGGTNTARVLNQFALTAPAEEDLFALGSPVVTGISNDTGVSASDGITRARKFAVQGTGAAGLTVLLYQDGRSVGSGVVGSDNTWSIRPKGGELKDGTYRFTAVLVSPTGEMTVPSDPFVVTVNNRQPSMPVVRSSTYPLIVGMADPGNTVNVFAEGSDKLLGSSTADASGNWSLSLSSVPTRNGRPTRLYAVATSLAGNRSKPTDHFRLVFGPTTPPPPPPGAPGV